MPDNQAALILLAAGSSSRMGRPKQLLEFEGKPLVRHAAERALDAGCGPVIVVLGARAGEIRNALNGLDVEIVVNDRWMDGMGGSIQAGLRALGGREALGAILALGDQPFVTSAMLRGLVDKHVETGKPIVASRYSATVGVPAFFAPGAFGWLMALKPSEGCKPVIMRQAPDAVLVDNPEAAVDIDTPEDYAAVVGLQL